MKLLQQLVLVILILAINQSFAQYNDEAKGKNRIYKTQPLKKSVEQSDGSYEVIETMQEVAVTADKYGNAAGNQYDLATDGAFEGSIPKPNSFSVF